MVTYAQCHGNKPCARAFGTTVKTVRKWRSRYEKHGYKGLYDLSRAPKDPPLKIPDSSKRRVISLKKRLRSFGAERLKRDFGVVISVKAIRKIWREKGLTRRKRKKHKTKKDLRAIKSAWKLFEQIDVDTKHLYDIPEYWPQMRHLRLPSYQYTARDVVSGTQFLGFADECCLSYATLFADLLIRHLTLCGVELSGSRIQTDNGSEFIGSWQAKESSAFTERIEEVQGLTHHTIPPGAHTHQADVETAHRLIEDEFYEVEHFSSRRDFLAKATTYQLWFNVARRTATRDTRHPGRSSRSETQL
jgi:transposase